eukprot:1393868-Amorphochlora_amoeboformis.AAC.4
MAQSASRRMGDQGSMGEPPGHGFFPNNVNKHMGSSPAAHGDTLHGASWASGPTHMIMIFFRVGNY